MSATDKESVVKYLEENLLKYPDFPKPGIIFRDTFSLFRNPDAFKKIVDLFSDHISTLGNVDGIVGLEARGFVIGSACAYKLGLPFIPIRKKGKLPGQVISYKYELEYGSDVFEMQEDAVKQGQRVVIVDDLIATGGTCAAAIELIKKKECSVLDCIFLVEFTDLDWKKKLNGAKTTSFIKIDSSS